MEVFKPNSGNTYINCDYYLHQEILWQNSCNYNCKIMRTFEDEFTPI